MPIQFTAGKASPDDGKYVQPGDYRLRVLSAREDTSKSGNDMIALELRVLHDDGSEGPIFPDTLIFTETSFWKIDHFLKSAGQHPGEGERLDLDPDEMIGWELEATLKVVESEERKTNAVASYLWDDEF